MNILSIHITRQVVMVKHGIVLRQKKNTKTDFRQNQYL